MCTHIYIPMYLYLQGYRRDAAHILYPKTLQGAIYALVMPLQDQGAEGESNQTPISNKTSISLVCSDLLLEKYPWAAPIDSEDGRGCLGGGGCQWSQNWTRMRHFVSWSLLSFRRCHTHIHTHPYTHTYAHTRIHTYTHTHTHTRDAITQKHL